jgi:hypothetical protein
MQKRSMFALVVLTLGACGTNDPPRPKSDVGVGAEVAQGMDAAPPADAAIDTASPEVAPGDLPAADRVDAATPDGAAADSGGDAALPDAGPDGAAPDLAPPDVAADGGVVTCGTASREMLCTSYCQGMGMICTGANAQFRNADECRAACNAPASSWACGTAGQTSGNSLYCRLAHMALAGVGGAAVECPNAGPSSAVCR